MKKNSAILLSLGIIFGLLVAGCAPATQTPVRDSLVVAMGGNPVTLDPQGSNDSASARVHRQLYDTLILQTEDLELVPALATEWRAIDDLTWEFELRPGVKFHNGETLTASDVKFTLERALASAYISHIVGPIDKDSITVVDELTIRFATTEPFAPILAHLAHPAMGILNEKAVTEGGEDYGTNPVGTGPFKFVSWDFDEKVTLERFEDYFGTKALLREVVFRIIPDNTVRTVELETGGADIVFDIQPADINRVGADPTLTLVRDPNLSVAYIGFNTQKEPFDDVRVRQAINLALDMPAIVNAVYKGVGSPAVGPLGSNVFGANLELEAWGFDQARARELLAEAGLADGFETTIWTNDNAQRVQIAEIVKEQLSQVGITVTIVEVEWSKYLADTAAGLHDMFILGWTTVTADADYGLFPLFHTSAKGTPGNRTFYSNARVDELLDLGRTTKDEATRLEAYMEAQEIIRNEAPWIFTWNGENISGTHSSVTGFVQHPAGHHRLDQVTFSE